MQIDDTRSRRWSSASRWTDGNRASPSPSATTRWLSAGEVEGRAARRVYRPGRAEHLRDLSPVGREDGEAGGADRGEGQHWNLAPGNLLSKRGWFGRPGPRPIRDLARKRHPADSKPEKDTKYIRHIRIQSALLTKFWGRRFISRGGLAPEATTPIRGALSTDRIPRPLRHWLQRLRETPPDPDLKPD